MKANNKKIKNIKNIKISSDTHYLLKKYCKKHGLKMFAFVELLIKDKCKSHLGKDVISRIVNGKKQNYEIHTLLKICLALNCTPNQIIEKDNFIETQIK